MNEELKRNEKLFEDEEYKEIVQLFEKAAKALREGDIKRARELNE